MYTYDNHRGPVKVDCIYSYNLHIRLSHWYKNNVLLGLLQYYTKPLILHAKYFFSHTIYDDAQTLDV